MTNQEGKKYLEIIIFAAQNGSLKTTYLQPDIREALADDTVLNFESYEQPYEGTFSDILRSITFNEIGASGSPLPFWQTAFTDLLLGQGDLISNLALNFAGFGATILLSNPDQRLANVGF